MSWLWAVIFLSFTFSDYKFITEAKHQKKLPSAVIVGTVYCDTCFQQDFSKAKHFLAGASVAVECKDNTSSSSSNFRKEVKTNKHGEFQVHLPLSVSKHINKIKLCSVQLIRSNEPLCAVAATATSSNLYLKSRKQGAHIFSAGFFTFKPLNQPEVCDQKPIVKSSRNTEKLSPIENPNDPTFLPPIRDPQPDPPTLGGVLPLPQLPIVSRVLPPLPGIPVIPAWVKRGNSLEDNKVNQPTTFPPNPFNPFPPNPLNPPSLIPPNPLLPPPLIPPNPLLPPPSLLPPNPFQPPPSVIPPIIPSPPPSIFPPFLPSPPSPPFLPLPPIPGLTPSPPPPAQPTFPIPFPPFPFQPTPGFPGVPPAEASSESKTSSP